MSGMCCENVRKRMIKLYNCKNQDGDDVNVNQYSDDALLLLLFCDVSSNQC